MTKQEKIEHLKMMIKADEEVWDTLYREEQQIKNQREKIWSRKHNNQIKLKKLLGIDGVL